MTSYVPEHFWLAGWGGAGQAIAVGLAEEVDEAPAVGAALHAAVTVGEEVDEAPAVTAAKHAAVTVAEEIDEALQVGASGAQMIQVGLAEEIDEALAVSGRSGAPRVFPALTRLDTRHPLRIPVREAVEIDEALAVWASTIPSEERELVELLLLELV